MYRSNLTFRPQDYHFIVTKTIVNYWEEQIRLPENLNNKPCVLVGIEIIKNELFATWAIEKESD